MLFPWHLPEWWLSYCNPDVWWLQTWLCLTCDWKLDIHMGVACFFNFSVMCVSLSSVRLITEFLPSMFGDWDGCFLGVNLSDVCIIVIHLTVVCILYICLSIGYFWVHLSEGSFFVNHMPDFLCLSSILEIAVSLTSIFVVTETWNLSKCLQNFASFAAVLVFTFVSM